MGYYSKDGNIVTLKKNDKSSTIFTLIFSSFFWIPFAMAGFFLLYVLIFKDIYEEDTNEKMSILARILFFVFMDVPFLFISYAIISGYLRILNDLIYPNSFKIDINSKLCIYESSRQKVKISFESDCFKKICYDLISRYFEH